MLLVLGVLGASLLGSVHCAGMCGPFVCYYAVGPGNGIRSHAAYNVGRLLSYATLGAVAGVAGSTLDRLGALAGVSRVAAILSGTAMVAWGLSTVLAQRGMRIFPAPGRGAPGALGAALARLRRQPAVVRAGAIGLLTTLLPCGWLYAFVAAAAGTGRVDVAILTMVAFWLGTLPVMVAAGYSVQRLAGPWRARLPMVSAVAVVVIGLLSIAGRLRVEARLSGPSAGHPAAAHARH
ncbi:MAG: hypothetical protein MNPFHGCM_03003 [Gemmatimonadaceae bacterium]|nr:hypothetical protein [Gemmatimonadaceae bacterium]